MIDQKLTAIGDNVNGWLVSPDIGSFGNDYLLRAATAKWGFPANIAQEALHAAAFTDMHERPLDGDNNNNYTIHFNPGQTPPVKAFWSITMYNDNGTLVNNPLNRYNIGGLTKGLKNNTDGSLDIYIQHVNPGKDKESNWLPAPSEGKFDLIMRLYLPQPKVFNGTWQYPTVLLQGQQH